MLTTNELLDSIKQRHGIPSDYKLGLVLGLSKNAIPQYRKGISCPEDAVAAKIAELLDLDPLYVVACMHAERARTDTVKSLWISMANRLLKSPAVPAFALFALAFMNIDALQVVDFAWFSPLAVSFFDYSKAAYCGKCVAQN